MRHKTPVHTGSNPGAARQERSGEAFSRTTSKRVWKSGKGFGVRIGGWEGLGGKGKCVMKVMEDKEGSM